MSTTKKRTWPLNKAIDIQHRLAGQIRNLYLNADRFHWDSDFIQEGLHKIYNTEDYQRLPGHIAAYLGGVIDTLRHFHWQKVVFSYEIKGKRLSIESEEYRKVKPQYVSENCSHTGCFIYRDSGKIFTKPLEAERSDKPSLWT